MPKSTFLGEISRRSIHLTDGRHYGVFELYIGGMHINRLGVEHFEGNNSVEGVDTIFACRDEPVLRVAVTAKSDGTTMDYDEIKSVAISLTAALQTWALSLKSESVERFTRIREVRVNPVGMVEHSETTIHELDG